MKSNQDVKNCKIGLNTRINEFVNLYGCTIGDDSMIGTFVEIQSGVVVGNRVRVQSHTFICEGVEIEDDVFIGHGVMFANDRYPRAVNDNGTLKSKGDWKMEKIVIRKGASIGSNATLVGPVVIGEGAMVGAGAVVVKDVPPNITVVGNPARAIKRQGLDEA